MAVRPLKKARLDGAQQATGCHHQGGLQHGTGAWLQPSASASDPAPAALAHNVVCASQRFFKNIVGIVDHSSLRQGKDKGNGSCHCCLCDTMHVAPCTSLPRPPRLSACLHSPPPGGPPAPHTPCLLQRVLPLQARGSGKLVGVELPVAAAVARMDSTTGQQRAAAAGAAVSRASHCAQARALHLAL